MQKKLLLFVLCILVLGVSLFAQTTGRLMGTVRDDRNNPVPYANVIIAGENIGATTDDRGRFTIINIRPDVYKVQVQHPSYATFTMENVRISLDETRSIDFKLQRSSVEMDEYVVTAEDILIRRGASDSSTSISSDQIKHTAVSDVDGLISLTSGVTRSPDGSLNVRGGRANEVVFTVDGMSVSDPVDGGRALSVDMDAIADMKVMTGGFTAEYGNAQSGMVNIVTKDGSDKWEGKIEALTDHLFTEASNYDEVKFALGGPVPIYLFNSNLKKKFTFFLNGAAQWDDTRHRKHYQGSPSEDLLYLTTQFPVYDPYESRDKVLGFEIGNRNNNNYNLNLKTSYAISPTQKLTMALRGDRSYRTPFSHTWRYALQHYAEAETNQQQVMFTYDHVFDSKRTLQVKGSYFNKTEFQNPRSIDKTSFIVKKYLDDPDYYNPATGIGLHGWVSMDENRDGINDVGYFDSSLWKYNINTLEDARDLSRVASFRAPGTIWDTFIDDESTQYSMKADYEYQVSQVVGMKTGFEVIQHKILKNQLGGFLTFYENRYWEYLTANCVAEADSTNPLFGYYSAEDYYQAAVAASGRRDGYRAEPMQFAYYAQTKLDWEGMIVNAGVRMDLWYLGSSYDILQDDGSYKKNNSGLVIDDEGNLKENAGGFDSSDRFQVMISPRLGVSHPISERDVLHFAYNYQNQLPQMRYIFTTRDSIHALLDEPGVLVGNPTLEPQITVTYEVGLQHLLTEDYVMGITAYYKNIYNYVSTKKVLSKTDHSVYWYEYISDDYGSSRGLDVTLNRRLYNFITGGMSYSVAWAHGNNSDVVIQDEATNLREFPLDWDIRHQFNFNSAFIVGRGEEWIVPFTEWAFPISDFSVAINYNIASGRPYTPMSQEGSTQLETNSKRMPYTTNADLRLAKNIHTGGSSYIRASFTIENLFKMNNINSVYGRTGSPYYDNADIGESSQNNFVFAETQYIHDFFTKNPSNVNNTRNYIFGLSFNF